MKKCFLFVAILSLTIISAKTFSQQGYDYQKQWKYFKIYFNLDEIKAKDTVNVKKLRDGLEMSDNPQFQKMFQVVVDIRPKKYKYVVYGDFNSDLMSDPTAYRYPWDFLSITVRGWLVNYTGKNKINKEEK
jgi:hypothetical protein